MRLRVATFNIQHGRTPKGAVDAGLVGTACASLAADVIGLQEVDVGLGRSHNEDLAAVAASAAGLRHAFAPALRIGDGEYGNALLVRGAIDEVEVVTLPAADGDDEDRCALVARATVDGASVSVAVTHLSVYRDRAPAQLPRVLAALGRRRPPRVLLGDLNLAPARVAPLTAAAGLQLAGGPPTFPARRPRRRIDHVAVAGLGIAGVVVPPAAPVSDHRPLVVELDG